MRILFCAFFVLLVFSVHAQKNYFLSTASNFNFGLKGFGTNDAGIGLTIQSNFFTKRKLQLRAEGSLNHFIGNKVFYGEGNPSNPTAVAFKAGPELFFITERISIAALYGYISYKFKQNEIRSGNFKLAFVSHLGIQKRTLLGLCYTKLTRENLNTSFWGVNIGYRII